MPHDTATAKGRNIVCAKETCPNTPTEERMAIAAAQTGEVSRMARADSAASDSWAFNTRGSLSAFSPGRLRKAKTDFRKVVFGVSIAAALLKFY